MITGDKAIEEIFKWGPTGPGTTHEVSFEHCDGRCWRLNIAMGDVGVLEDAPTRVSRTVNRAPTRVSALRVGAPRVGAPCRRDSLRSAPGSGNPLLHIFKDSLVSVHGRAHDHLLLIKLDGVRCARPRHPLTMVIMMIGNGSCLLPFLQTAMRGMTGSGDGVHVLTGPIFVETAEPGDVLKVEILKLYPRLNPQGETYGVNVSVTAESPAKLL